MFSHCKLTVAVLASAVWVVPVLAVSSASAGDVSLEILTTDETPITSPQEWLETLQEVGATGGVRFTRASGGEKLEVKESGTGASARYTIVGMLTSRGDLRLPGASFSKRDRIAIREYIAKVSSGQDGTAPAAPAGAFGLSGEEIVALHEALGRGVLSESTKDATTRDVVTQIAAASTVPVTLSASARTLLGGDEKVRDELKGVAAGTALAAVVRPLGLVVVPQKSAGQIKMHVVDVREAEQSWPVGWPLEEKERTKLPKLYEFLDVEIEGVPLSDAIGAIAGRLDAAALYDHNGLARKQISISENVSMPAGKTYYRKIIDRLTSQLRLTASVRVDEAGKPFLWVEPIGK